MERLHELRILSPEMHPGDIILEWVMVADDVNKRLNTSPHASRSIVTEIVKGETHQHDMFDVRVLTRSGSSGVLRFHYKDELLVMRQS